MGTNEAPLSFFITLVLLVLSILVTVISRMLIFEKAGRSNVSAFIPFLNFYVMLRLVGMKPVLTLFYFVTLLNLFLSLKTLGPLLLPDEIVEDRLSLMSFITPWSHPQAINAFFVIFWVLNVFYFLVYIRLHLKLALLFGKSKAFGVGMALLEPVFYPILAFGMAKANGHEALK